jgi:hypothetical protein
MKTTSLLAAGIVASGAAATSKLTPDAIEKDIHTDKSESIATGVFGRFH